MSEAVSNTNNNVDREAQFLAAQKTRLSNITKHNDNDEYSNGANGDSGIEGGIQQQRKLFWIVFKQECSILLSRLEALHTGTECADGADVAMSNANSKEEKEEIKNSAPDECGDSNSSNLYVTAQQRNAAYLKLQEIQNKVRLLNHYILNSTKLTSTTNKHDSSASVIEQKANEDVRLEAERKLLPQQFLQQSMPDLPLADQRLANVEIQTLKEKAQVVQNVIMPKEKFRFRRYRERMMNRNSNGKEVVSITSEDEEGGVGNVLGEPDVEQDNVGATLGGTKDSQKQPLHKGFDGPTLSNQKDSAIMIPNSGPIQIKGKGDNNQSHSTETMDLCSDVSNAAKSILFRDLDNCELSIEMTYESIHIINVKNSTFHINKVIGGPVHVTNCHNTTIHIAFCRQLRIHDCTDTSFWIHVSSGPIIEGCKGMKFYQKDLCDDEVAKNVPNLYWDVKDFHWLKGLVKSPNFETIAEENVGNTATGTSLDCNGVVPVTGGTDEEEDESSDEDEL